mmetsp:Transcript_11223/g.20742  ORF Transcript_11223/g.20742 Transcript_11223/m.20742 type:complete len:270 (+) Transcript_11223:65-874(+)
MAESSTSNGTSPGVDGVAAAAAAGGCPVKHGDGGEAPAECPMGKGEGASKVFLQQAGAQAETEEDDIDPRNNMPRVAEQKPWPGQSMPLSTTRQESVIPRSENKPEHQSNTASTSSWVYPSEQQFYNAMKRKGWKPREEDMKVVLSIHNHVNDRAWSEVMRFEEELHPECDCPKLARFMGRPKDLSPKANLRSWLGYAKPFDRHDWYVDRCGEEVRYVIDFYSGTAPPEGASHAVSMFLDARPALDNWQAVVDRARMGVKDLFKSFGSS